MIKKITKGNYSYYFHNHIFQGVEIEDNRFSREYEK